MSTQDEDEQFYITLPPYNAVENFDEMEVDAETINMNIRQFADSLKNKGHTCPYMGSYYVGWCGHDICEDNDDPKPALD